MSLKNQAYSTRSIAGLTWPIAMNAIFLQSIVIIDTVLVTPLGEGSLAAMGLAVGFATILTGVLFAFSNATQLLVAQAFGAQNQEEQQTWFWSGLSINLIIAFASLALVFSLSHVVFASLAPTPLVATEAGNYLQLFSLALLGLAITQNVSVFFNATRHSKIPFYSNLLELPVNTIMSWMLIHGLWVFPAMGVSGAALGSGIAVFIRLVFLIVALRRTNPDYLRRKAGGKIWPTLAIALHFRRSLPIAGNFITMSLSISVCMLLYAKLGVNQFAALTLLFPWIRVAGHVVTAWGTATGILVGQILGGESWELIDEFVSRSWRVALVLGVMVSLAYFGMYFIFEWIYPDLQSETLEYLWQLLPILLLLPLIRTSNIICGHVLRAGGDAGYVFKIHALTQWLLTVPLTATFVLYLELSVIWVFTVVMLEEMVKAVPFHMRLIGGKWKRKLTV